MNAPKPDHSARVGSTARWTAALAIVLLSSALVVGAAHQRGHRPTSLPYVVGQITRGDVVQNIDAAGTLQPQTQVQVGTQVGGRVLSVHATFNQHVARGDLLAVIDPTPFLSVVAQQQAVVRSARAQQAHARADLTLQEKNLQRATMLRRADLNAKADLDAARAARDDASAQLDVMGAQLDQALATLVAAQANAANTRIYAPIDGVVIGRFVEAGQTLPGGFQAPVVFVIAQDLRHMQVVANVSETQVAHVAANAPTDVHVDAFPADSFRGIVREVRFTPTATQQDAVTYPAVIDVENPDLKLRPGMTASITISTARHDGVLRAPNAALRYRPSGASASADRAGTGRLYVLEHGAPTEVPVRLGITDGVFTEIVADQLRGDAPVILDEVRATNAVTEER